MSKVDFFKPEDFMDTYTLWSHENVARLANEKLAREGKVVYFVPATEKCWDQWLETVPKGVGSKTALLIDIKPIVKCEHPKVARSAIVERSDLRKYDNGYSASILLPVESYWTCGYCGAKVEPSGYREVPK